MSTGLARSSLPDQDSEADPRKLFPHPVKQQLLKHELGRVGKYSVRLC